ncbi:type II toxin-antitoxin system VapC family toxin [Candidatus Woesearchaeota archaeon]|nr:type II toxin-antitoxin system VapC family toxin [Candidatus Woesearchaeota archaeon]
MYCLDANVIIDIFRGDAMLKKKFVALQAEQATFTITPIVLSELYRGAFLAHNALTTLTMIEDFLRGFELLLFDKISCIYFGEIHAKLQKEGKTTQTLDLMTASIVIAHRNILITRNEKHFEHIPDLQYEVW